MRHSLRFAASSACLLALTVSMFSRGQDRPADGTISGARETASSDPSGTPDQLEFFEKNIRPVLVKECYTCHAATAKEIQGGLTLDTREGIRRGGDTGPAVVPGDVRNSLLIKAIKQTSDDLAMPPEKKLPAEVIADFEKWIALGAPDPRDGAAKTYEREIDIEKGRHFWAFQPPQKPAVPTVRQAAWPKSDVDRFLLSELESKGLKPVADADPRTLLRRVYFDIVGLPPSPADVADFLKQHELDPQAALAAAVDKLLSSPQFGERWGRHWLDVARYAESSGRAANFAYPHAWRYRDYVIAAFNADKPYHQFIREQLAGDLLSPKDDQQKAEFLVATGFLAIGPKSLDERSPRQFQMDVADEQIDATFQAFQGLTAACARCHDHKFDPIPQKDYYALAGIFRSTETCYGTIRVIQSNHPSPLITLPGEAEVTMPLGPLTSERRASIEKQINDLQDQSREMTGTDAFIRRLFLRSRIATLQSQLALYESDGAPKPLAMGVRERRIAMDSPVFVRGELDQPGPTVRRGFPQVLTTEQPSIRWGSGRRELADWIASQHNPLTARVMANRVWLHLVGRGIVPTPDNFGASGQPPSHPQLLDYLAISFVENGWSVKKLIRTIVLSRAYQLSSEMNEQNFDVDPDNVLVWRIPKRRLEAEALRDSMLALSGALDLAPPKASTVAYGGEGNVSFRFRAMGGLGMSGPGMGRPGMGGPGRGGGNVGADSHRTVYTAIVRDSLPESLSLFDFPDPSLIVGERATTTVPAQSLYLMNNPFVIHQAELLADRILADRSLNDSLLADGGGNVARLTRLYLLCYSRPPSETELASAEQFLADYGSRQPRRATWTALCQAMIASAEFAHR
jgi:hypothetical protein